MAVLPIVQKSFDLRRQRKAAAFSIHHKNGRSIGYCCHLIGAGRSGIAANPVIIAHHAFQNGKLRVCRPFSKQRLQLLLRKKEAVQVAAVDTQNVFVKHRVDVVRAAFERTAADAAVLKQGQKAGGKKSLAAAASRSCQQDTGKICILLRASVLSERYRHVL